MPATARVTNKSYNRLYLLPLLLGLLGLFVQAKFARRDALVTGILFFFTGLAIVIYLNQSGMQPRERDYAFAGSFYVFAIWIGLGVIGIQQLLDRLLSSSRRANPSGLTRTPPVASDLTRPIPT